MSTTFETRQRGAKAGGGGAVRPSLSARRCGCGASPGLDGVCEECRRNRLTSSQASPSSSHHAAEHAPAASTHGHDFGRVGVLAPQDQTPTQSGGLDEKFVEWNAPPKAAEDPSGQDLDLGEKRPLGDTTPVVDSVELVTSSAGAVGGYPEGILSCDASLNKPGPFNDPWYSGSVSNVHQVQFHVSKGRPEYLKPLRMVNRTSVKPYWTDTKAGNDGPPDHEILFTKDKLVVADAPGFCGGPNGLKYRDFPLTYTADFSTYAYDPLTMKVLASISYRVEIAKNDFLDFNPTNKATVKEKKIGAAVASPVKPKK